MRNNLINKHSNFSQIPKDQKTAIRKPIFPNNLPTKQSQIPNMFNESQPIKRINQATASKKSSVGNGDKIKPVVNIIQSDNKIQQLDEISNENIEQLKTKIQQLNHLFLNAKQIESDNLHLIQDVAAQNTIVQEIIFLRKENTELKKSLLNCSQYILQLNTQIQNLRNQSTSVKIEETYRQEEDKCRSPIKLLDISTSINLETCRTQKNDFHKQYIEKVYKEYKMLQSQNSSILKKNSELQADILRLKREVQSKIRLTEYLTKQLITLNKSSTFLQKNGSTITFACNSNNSLLDYFHMKPK